MDGNSVSIRPISLQVHLRISIIQAALIYTTALEINDLEAYINIKYTLIISYPNRDHIEKSSGSF